MPNKGSQFRPGMYAKVEFTDKSSAAGAGVLPYMSLVTVESKNYVFVEKSPGEFERREVTIGSSGLDKISIVEGIGKGETVVTTGAMLLKGLSFGY
ncbi:MAG: hypothetical protein K8R21_15310 [Leptospira sp.]|nr:hypothetical protein [Leptospira sp.]